MSAMQCVCWRVADQSSSWAYLDALEHLLSNARRLHIKERGVEEGLRRHEALRPNPDGAPVRQSVCSLLTCRLPRQLHTRQIHTLKSASRRRHANPGCMHMLIDDAATGMQQPHTWGSECLPTRAALEACNKDSSCKPCMRVARSRGGLCICMEGSSFMCIGI